MEEIITWEDLTPFMAEVRAMAHDLLQREWHAESLQTTGLVLTALRRQKGMHQDWSEVTWQNRRYFFGAMYQAMGRALKDHGRKRMAKKRVDMPIIQLEDLQLENLYQAVEETPERVVALVEALEDLQELHPEWSEMIEHRFYGGLTTGETARIMEMSESTVKRTWRRARALLYDEVLRRLKEV